MRLSVKCKIVKLLEDNTKKSLPDRGRDLRVGLMSSDPGAHILFELHRTCDLLLNERLWQSGNDFKHN